MKIISYSPGVTYGGGDDIAYHVLPNGGNNNGYGGDVYWNSCGHF